MIDWILDRLREGIGIENWGHWTRVNTDTHGKNNISPSARKSQLNYSQERRGQVFTMCCSNPILITKIGTL